MTGKENKVWQVLAQDERTTGIPWTFYRDIRIKTTKKGVMYFESTFIYDISIIIDKILINNCIVMQIKNFNGALDHITFD